MLIVPFGSHTVGNVLRDLPISPAITQLRQGLVQPLDSPFGAGKGAVLLERRSAGENDIGITAGFAKEDILHDEEVQLLESSGNDVGV